MFSTKIKVSRDGIHLIKEAQMSKVEEGISLPDYIHISAFSRVKEIVVPFSGLIVFFCLLADLVGLETEDCELLLDGVAVEKGGSSGKLVTQGPFEMGILMEEIPVIISAVLQINAESYGPRFLTAEDEAVVRTILRRKESEELMAFIENLCTDLEDRAKQKT